jgi:hypothetical protein
MRGILGIGGEPANSWEDCWVIPFLACFTKGKSSMRKSVSKGSEVGELSDRRRLLYPLRVLRVDINRPKRDWKNEDLRILGGIKPKPKTKNQKRKQLKYETAKTAKTAKTQLMAIPLQRTIRSQNLFQKWRFLGK